MRAFLVLLLLLPVLLPAAVAGEEIDIRVQGSAGRDLRVAVQRFASDDFAIEHVDPFDDELAGALRIAASFELVDPAAFLEPRQTQAFDDASIVCENWRGIGADALVQGRLERRRASVRVRYRIWDVGRCRLQGRAGYIDAPPDRVWVAARRLADELALRFTGRRGTSSTQLAFVSDKNGNKEIYLMEADGSRKRAVTKNGQINLFPAWSRDGEQLLYTSYLSGYSDLWTVSRGSRPGGRLIDLPHEKYRGIFGPADGQVTIVMNDNGNTDLFVGREDGRGLRRLTRSRAIDVSPTWSPDGKQLAFASDRTGTLQLYIRNGSSNEIRRLTFRGDYNSSPAWSPTGEWITYAARTGNNFDLYLIDPETGYTTPLMIHPRSDEHPVWSPDGRKVAFTSNRRGRKDIYVVDVDGRNLRRLTDGFGNCSNPAWSGWQD
jgi:TolB protein